MDLDHVLRCEMAVVVAKRDLMDGTRAYLRALEEYLVLLGVLFHLPGVHRVSHVGRRSIESHLLELAVVGQHEAALLPPVLHICNALQVLLLLILKSIVAEMLSNSFLVAVTIVENSVRSGWHSVCRLVQAYTERLHVNLLRMGALLRRVLHELLQRLVRVYFFLL